MPRNQTTTANGGLCCFLTTKIHLGLCVVRSARDKKWDNLAQTADSLKNHIKINDWNAVTADFDSLNKQLEKAKQIVAKEGVPTFYFSALIAL